MRLVLLITPPQKYFLEHNTFEQIIDVEGNETSISNIVFFYSLEYEIRMKFFWFKVDQQNRNISLRGDIIKKISNIFLINFLNKSLMMNQSESKHKDAMSD